VKGISHGQFEMTSSYMGILDARRQNCNCVFATVHSG